MVTETRGGFQHSDAWRALEDGAAPAFSKAETVTSTQWTPAAELVAELVARGIDRVFGIPGGTIAPVFDALVDSDVELILCQHETMAVYAASAYAEVTGKPGVLFLTSGPGVLNALTGIAAAYQSEVPLLVFCGEVARRSADRGALQDGGVSGLDIDRVLEPHTKRCETLNYRHGAAAMFDRCYVAAMSEPCGPVSMRLPVDVACSPGPRHPSHRGSPSQAPLLDDAACAELAGRLRAAERPLIWAGIGARRAGVAEALFALATATGTPVMTDLEAKGLFPENHRLSAGVFGVGGRGPAVQLMNEGVDLLLTLGARLDDTTTNNFSVAIERVPERIQLDHDARRLSRSYGATWAAHCNLRGAIERIASHLPSRARPAKYALPVHHSPESFTLGRGPHDPRAVIQVLRHIVGPEAIFTCDIGNHMLFASVELECDLPDSFYVSVGLGGMGSGIGYGIGLQLAHQEKRKVVTICGDGSVLMVGNELATCARYGIPTMFVVFNDGHLNMVEHGCERVFGRSVGCKTPNVDFCAYARSLGVAAIRIDTAADFDLVARRSLKAPLLVEVPIDPLCRAVNPREETNSFNFPSANELRRPSAPAS